MLLLTVVVEGPLGAGGVATGGWRLPWAGALGLSLIVPVASYIPLTAWYALTCPLTLLERTNFDPSLSFARGVAGHGLR